jgi:thioredoxin 1
MKKKIFLLVIISSLFFITCRSENPGSSNVKETSGDEVVNLTNETFKKLIFNYEINKDWKYEGAKPAIIDFYAEWCAPCRQISPIVEEIAKEYKGKIIVYKVDTDVEKTLAQKLGITGLPTLVFIPSSGRPKISMGALPKEDLIKVVKEVLFTK